MNPKTDPNLREILEQKHEEAGLPPRINIAPKVNSLREKKGTSPSTEEPSQMEHIKIEINALIAFLIEEIWKTLDKEEFKKNLRQMFFTIKYNHFEWIIHEMRTFLTNTTSTYLRNKQEESKNSPAITPYQRFCNLLKEENAYFLNRKRMIYIEYTSNDYHIPLDKIQPGINTAFEIIFGVAYITITTFKEKFKRPITKDEFNKLMKKNISIINILANLHINLFVKIRLNPEDFELRGDETNPTLDIKIDEIKKIAPSFHSSPTPRTGCPSIYASGGNNLNVISDMTLWITEIIEEFYWPILEKNQ